MSFEIPKPEDLIFDTSYFNSLNTHPGDESHIPENYVDLPDREYPTFKKIEAKKNENFEDFMDNFPPNFQPDQVLSELDAEMAITIAASFHNAGYRLTKGYLGILDMEESTVADILSKDIDTSIDRVKALLREGALVGPYVQMRTLDDSSYYAIGVALWMKP